MNTPTWKAAEPPKLSPATGWQNLRGYLRVSSIIALTLVLFLIFMTGRFFRKALGRWVSYHYLVALIWARICLRLLSLQPMVTGTPIRRGGILASNHVSWTDIMVLRSVTRINFVSKAEVRKWPVVGYIAHVCETVFIERKRTEAKRQQADLLARIENDELLCLFPEGTSTDGLRVLPFKSALMSVVFVPGVRERLLVQPVTLNYIPNPAHDLPSNFYGWWGTMGFGSHIWTLATRSKGGRVEITFHDPIKVSEYEDRKRLTLDCETAVRSSLPEHILENSNT